MTDVKKNLDLIDPLNERPKNESVIIRIPTEVLVELELEAMRRDTSRNKLITHILIHWLKKRS